VEGLTEFIPVSSTGHLILAGHLLGFTGDRAAAFEVFIQLGAILAVVWESRATLAKIASDLGLAAFAGSVSPAGRSRGLSAIANLALGFAPSALLGLALHDLIEKHLFTPEMVGWGLFVGGIGILAVEALAPQPRIHKVEAIPWKAALGVGVAQCLSLFPGVSRSAATILGGMTLGLDRRSATEFSFLLAIPTMLAAGLYDLYHWRHILGWSDVPAFAVGFVIAFAAGLATVKFLLRYVATHDFRPFAWYRIAVGAAAVWML